MLQKYSRHYVAEHKNDIERWNNYGVVYFFFSFLFGLHLACSIMLLKSLAWDCLSNLILLYASICIIMSYMWPLYIVAFKDIFHFVSVWCVDAFCVDTCMYIYIYLYTYVFFNIIGYTYNLPEKKTSDPPRPQAPGVPPAVPLQSRSRTMLSPSRRTRRTMLIPGSRRRLVMLQTTRRRLQAIAAWNQVGYYQKDVMDECREYKPC